MTEFVTGLFNPTGFPARWQCGAGWSETPWLGWLHILSDLGIWSAYIAIPLVLGFFLIRRKDLPFQSIFLLFGTFILACGTTHLMEAIIFWWPVYRLAGLIKLVTAIVSWATVLSLFRVVPSVMSMRSPEELEREIVARRRAEELLQIANADLEKRVLERTAALTATTDLLASERELLRTTLQSIGDGMIATDTQGQINFLNVVAEKLTGWTTTNAKGRPLEEVFKIVDEQTRQSILPSLLRALHEGIKVGPSVPTILISQDGTEWPVDESAGPIRRDDGSIAGAVLVFREVTERRRLEKENESRLTDARILASIVETSDDAIISKSLDGIIQSWNAGAERIFGYTPQEAIGRHIGFLIPPDRGDEEDRILDRLSGGQRIEHFDTRRLRKDQQLISVSVTISPIKDSTGRIVGASKIARDVSDRKQSEEQLRQRVEEIQTLLDTLPIGVFIAHDPDCQLITGNRAAMDLLRAKSTNLSKTAPHDQAPLNFRTFRNGKEVPAHDLPVQRAARGEQIRNEEIDDVFDDGTIIHTLISAAPLYDSLGRVRGSVASVLDVTERKRTELAIKEYQRFLRSSIDALSSHLAVLDENGIILEVNAAWRRFADANHFAGSGHGVGTNYLDICETLNGECGNGHDIATGIRQVMRGEIAEFEFEYPCHSPNDQRWFLMRTNRFQTPGPVRVVIAHENVTARHQAELALREADRRKNEFLATLAHELRNPLAPIRNSLQLMQMVGTNPQVIADSVSMMERQLTQLVRLVDDLMDVSRISRGKIELRKEPVELTAVINSAVETSRPLIEEMGHQLTLSLPPEPIYLDADLTRLAQVILNLLNNAAKYSEREGQIWLTAQREGTDVVMSIKDTGIGIDAEQVPYIFEMFTQLKHTQDRSMGGLGVGLTLVKRLVEMHGGSIEARSEGIGRGTEFLVRLPTINPPPASAPAPAPVQSEPEAASKKGPLRVLIVDDNRDNADSLSLLLQISGNETRTAYDGEEAVNAAREFQPDLILLDLGMPKLSGYDACQQIRAAQKGKPITIVAQTGWGQNEDRMRTRAAGFDHHLVKPIDPTAVFQLLSELEEARK